MRGPLATLIALAVFTSTAKAADIDAATKASNKQAIEFRHLIHANPELSNQEFETAELVATHLRSLGMDVKTGVAKTGVIGVLRGGKPGPVVAVRADMDALPVVERTNLPFKSTKRTTYLGQEVGVAHACGHDIHVAVGLGTATALASMRDDLPGTVKFIFQPAEEGVPPGEKGGASFMVEEGALERPRPDAIFALHSFPDFEVGEIGFTSGPTYASSDHFIIQIHGKQAHGAWPHLSVDPVVMASEVVQALQTIRSRNMHPRTAGVVSVGIIRGGERFNIIPEAVELQGTVRAYSEEVQDMVEARMHEILKGITGAHGGSYELEYSRTNPPTINHAALSAWARNSLVRAAGEKNVIDAEPVMGAEDFAYFANEIPGFYFRLGVVKPGTESGALHTPTFRADDSAVPVGIRAMTQLVVDFLNENPSFD